MRVFIKLVFWLLVIFATLGLLHKAGAAWFNPDERDYKIVSNHTGMSIDSFTITDKWVDSSGRIFFLDEDKNGTEDIAHIDVVDGYIKVGDKLEPVYRCMGNFLAEDARSFIESYEELERGKAGHETE